MVAREIQSKRDGREGRKKLKKEGEDGMRREHSCTTVSVRKETYRLTHRLRC
jgi:hypothetical protein